MALKLKGRIKREHRQACSYSMLITAGWTDKSERGGEGETARAWVSAGEAKKGHTSRHITSLHGDLKEVDFWGIKELTCVPMRVEDYGGSAKEPKWCQNVVLLWKHMQPGCYQSISQWPRVCVRNHTIRRFCCWLMMCFILKAKTPNWSQKPWLSQAWWGNCFQVYSQK